MCTDCKVSVCYRQQTLDGPKGRINVVLLTRSLLMITNVKDTVKRVNVIIAGVT